jgi:hypothetical protein
MNRYLQWAMNCMVENTMSPGNPSRTGTADHVKRVTLPPSQPESLVDGIATYERLRQTLEPIAETR